MEGRIMRMGPLVGGIVAGLLSLVTLWLVGLLGAGEARLLIESTLPTVRFLCSTTATASATILALMLTLLSLSGAHDQEFRRHHFERVEWISLYSTICLTLSVFVLLLLVVPLSESEKIPVQMYTVLYYVILGAASVLGGLIVAIMLMLYTAITGLIRVVHPEVESPLVRTPDEDEPEAIENRDEYGERDASERKREKTG